MKGHSIVKIKKKRMHTVTNPKKSPVMTLMVGIFAVYCMLPLLWLVINATKDQADFISTFGLAFGERFSLFDNIARLFSYDDGIFVRWFLNSVLYVAVTAVGASLLAALGGYALAKIEFRGKTALLLVILGSIAVPGIALAIPQFLLFAQLGITNTPFAVIIPSLVNPFGLYLMWVFSSEAIPDSLLEAARIDGANERTIFSRVALPMIIPAFVTVLLFSVVSIWNNFFLPLIMLRDAQWYPLTIGIYQWNAMGSSAGSGAVLQDLVLTGSLLTVLPMIAAFIALQRFWKDGIALGAVKA